MEETYCYNQILVNFLWGGKDDEDKRRQKTDQT
jgi:hypothetical protein